MIKKLKASKGFTLIELMIVVAIIGILAAVAIPKFSQLIAKSNEANTKANLGSMRSALSIYYGDLEGWYPADNLDSIVAVGKYMSSIPDAKIPRFNNQNIGHGNSPAVEESIDDAGGWYYENDLASVSDWGRVFVNCEHNDSRGTVWSTF